MTKLTEDMVIARTRTSDLGTIKKFNCWGSDLHDISIIRKFTGVEVLSLSINRISTLADIAYCQNLVELYIRRNEIADLSEICYLQEGTPRLKRLLLSENPCVDSLGALYRPTVLRCLPGLEQLDGEDVLPEEVEHARQHGLILQHPLQTKRERVSPEPPVYYRDSPPMPASHSQAVVPRNQYDYESESPPQYRTVSHSPPADFHYYNGAQGKAAEPASNTTTAGSTSTTASITNTTTASATAAASVSAAGTNANAPNASNGLTPPRTANSSRTNSQNASPTNIPAQANSAATAAATAGQNPSLQRRISSPDYGREQQLMITNGRRQSADYNYDQAQQEQQYFDSPMRAIPNSARELYSNNNVRGSYKSRTKTSNLLSAVLCLIPELDWASLEVVELAVKRRMDEFPGD